MKKNMIYIGLAILVILAIGVLFILRKPEEKEPTDLTILDPSSYGVTLILETEKQQRSFDINVDADRHDVYIKDNYFEEVEESLYRFKESEKNYVRYTFECSPDSEEECIRDWIELKYDCKTEEEVREKDLSNLYLDVKNIIQKNKITEGNTVTLKENTYFLSYIDLLNNIKINNFDEFSFYYSMKDEYINGVALINQKNEKIYILFKNYNQFKELEDLYNFSI